ncbi:MAG: serine hydrolase [Gammaproteobacteria bacterium]|nr:serine hydrolase [Gammaproteobacteria bacterium]
MPRSTVPVTVQNMRRAMMDADLNSLTFHTMDQLFTTRTVPRSGAPWMLPRADHALDFTYEFKGARHTPEEFMERTCTNALLVMKDGRIVSESYRNNTSPATRFIVWSVTKSIVSMLVGIAMQEGRIQSLDDPVVRYLPELKGGGYDGVTIRQVLQMRSGVDYEERYDFGNPGRAARNHEYALVQNVVRFAEVARTIPRKHPPGAVWEYKTLDTAVLGWLLERVSGGSNVSAYLAQRIWEPLGAEADGFFIMDGPPGTGREFTGAGFNATLRDLGRLGQMMLDGGVANGRRVLSADWVREATRPLPTGIGPGYGYQWWMIAQPGAYQAIGLQGQFIHVDPATRTVVVKLSYFPPEDQGSELEVAAFLQAVSAWKPR